MAEATRLELYERLGRPLPERDGNQRTIMSPDVQYGFDCEVELLGFTSEVHQYFSYFRGGNVDDWYDNIHKEMTFEKSKDFCDRFAQKAFADYKEWFRTDDTLRRGVCVINGVVTFRYLLHDLTLALIGEKLDHWAEFAPADKIIEKICTQEYVKRQLKKQPQAVRYTQLWDDISERFAGLPPGHLEAAIAYNHVLLEERQKATFTRAQARRRMEYEGNGKVHVINPKQEKKAIKKSVDFLESIVGQRNTHLFISGETVKVTGEKFDFVVKKGHKLGTTNHGGVDLAVTNKAGKEIVKLCWYVKDTYAAEQMAALAMHVAAGNEDEIIRVGNIISTSNVEEPEFDMIDKLKAGKARSSRTFELQDGIENERMERAWTVTEQVFEAAKPWYAENLPKCFESEGLRIMTGGMDASINEKVAEISQMRSL